MTIDRIGQPGPASRASQVASRPLTPAPSPDLSQERGTGSAEQPVEHFMTTDLVSVTENTPLQTIVQQMVDAHIHRVVVLDDHQHLQGIISTMDVLAALRRFSQ